MGNADKKRWVVGNGSECWGSLGVTLSLSLSLPPSCYLVTLYLMEEEKECLLYCCLTWEKRSMVMQYLFAQLSFQSSAQKLWENGVRGGLFFYKKMFYSAFLDCNQNPIPIFIFFSCASFSFLSTFSLFLFLPRHESEFYCLSPTPRFSRLWKRVWGELFLRYCRGNKPKLTQLRYRKAFYVVPLEYKIMMSQVSSGQKQGLLCFLELRRLKLELALISNLVYPVSYLSCFFGGYSVWGATAATFLPWQQRGKAKWGSGEFSLLEVATTTNTALCCGSGGGTEFGKRRPF